MRISDWSSDVCSSDLQHVRFVQDNVSHSHRGVLRGLHYQVKHPQGKLLRVTQGTIFDVVVDLRRDSPTFGRWEGLAVSAAGYAPDPAFNAAPVQLWIPPGFAQIGRASCRERVCQYV